MNHSIPNLNLEFLIAVAVIIVVYLLPRFKYSQSQHILRTPSNLRQGTLSFAVSILLIAYHGYSFSVNPSWFLECASVSEDVCGVEFFQGLGFLLGYNHPELVFTEYGHHSRLIFCAISLFSLGISFHFYGRHINENRQLKEQLLQLKRKCEVLIERYENPAYDSKDEFSSLYIDYNLIKLGLPELEQSLTQYRHDPSLSNLNQLVEDIKQLKHL